MCSDILPEPQRPALRPCHGCSRLAQASELQLQSHRIQPGLLMCSNHDNGRGEARALSAMLELGLTSRTNMVKLYSSDPLCKKLFGRFLPTAGDYAVQVRHMLDCMNLHSGPRPVSTCSAAVRHALQPDAASRTVQQLMWTAGTRLIS